MPAYIVGSDRFASHTVQTATEPKLPQRTLDYLARSVPEGQRNPELFAAAGQFRDARIPRDEAFARLIPCGLRDGLTEAESRKTINSAYDRQPRDPIGGSAPPSGGAGAFNGAVPPKPPPRPNHLPAPIPSGLKTLLETCFLAGEYISISSASPNGPGEFVPGCGECLLRERWLIKLDKKSICQLYPDYCEGGLYIRINPLKAGGKTDKDVTAFRHALVEFDCDPETGNTLPKINQYQFMVESWLPIAAVLDSGNKSLHAWVRVDAADRKQYDQRVAIIAAWFSRHGAGYDAGNKNPSRYSRCPDCQRNLYNPDGTLAAIGDQVLRAINLGAPSWDDWIQAQAQDASQSQTQTSTPKVYIEFLSPSQIKAYNPPPGILLVGDNHIVRGGVFIIGGTPGVGKSRAVVGLGEAGATRYEWLGLSIHCNFKTLIVQNENGRYRLKLEFAQLDETLLDQYIRVTPPPPYGMCFSRQEFRDQLKAYLDNWPIDILVLDPWVAIARDDKARDYLDSFNLIRDVVPAGEQGPALGIVAHTRKPYPGERANGRALLNLLSGSLVLGSVPRTVWILQHASDDVAETRVVVTCAKNNDGELGPRTVWTRDNGIWSPVHGFDWDEWDHPDPDKKDKGISEAAMKAIFEGGKKALRKAEAVELLMKLTGKRKTACYAAFSPDGPFFSRLHFNKKTKIFDWIP
jgi:hypothetical protein